jgi:hypothetical protein
MDLIHIIISGLKVGYFISESSTKIKIGIVYLNWCTTFDTPLNTLNVEEYKNFTREDKIVKNTIDLLKNNILKSNKKKGLFTFNDSDHLWIRIINRDLIVGNSLGNLRITFNEDFTKVINSLESASTL